MSLDELPIPTLSALDPIYGAGSPLEEAHRRFDTLKSKFVAVFGGAPDLFARLPRRVNLIGEHIVYDAGSPLEEAHRRFNTLKSKFAVVFGGAPDLFARSPGQMNLIGEHIDYVGYSVIPMAIRQDTIVVIRKRDLDEGRSCGLLM